MQDIINQTFPQNFNITQKIDALTELLQDLKLSFMERDEKHKTERKDVGV